MIEDKTKEPQTAEPAQQPPKKRGQKLRSLWAQFQCMQLLRRHRFRRRTQHHVNHFSQKLLQNRLVLIVGEALYALGFSAEYAFVRVGRTVCRGVSGALLWVHSLRHTIVSMAFPGAAQMVRDLFGPIVLFFRGMGSLLVHAHRVRKEKGFGAAVKDSVHYLVGGVRRNVRTLPRMAMYILPVLALAGMVTVVQNTIRQPYALEVQVNGQTVGYVANEDVFNSAKEAVQERINYAGTDENTKWTVEPTYTISVAHSVLDENEMANAILKSSSDQISEGTALYLDGELTAVCSDGTALQSYLSSLLEPYENPEDPNVTVGFNKEVTLENGIYFNESFQQENDVESMLSGVQQQEKIYTVQTGDTLWSIAQKNDLTFRELCELNTNFKGAALTETSNIQAGDELIVTKQEATLEVRITKIETWQEEIPYASETTKSNEYNVGTKKTTQAGENGIRSVTAQRVYDTNGTQLSQQILSTEVIKEPVTEKIVVGTKKQAKTSYITGSGQFIWPVPGYRNCSRWYGGSHKGVDICAAAGTPIYASAGGTVTKAGYNKAGAGTGYGYSIIINHGNGYTTVYAHCLSLVVHAGQTAKQGIPLIEGNIHSSDVFYRQPSDEKPTYWEKLRDERGCLCVEMESFALFANAQVLGKNAACLLTISDSFVSPEITTAEQRQKSFTDMMKVALGAEY